MNTGNARLAATEVPGIRQRIRGGLTTVYQEADRYAVSVETIRRAVRGETFRFVREGLPDAEAPGVRYGRRREDVVKEDDAKASLERFMAEGNKLPADPTAPTDDGVDDFLSIRKGKGDPT